MSTGSVKIYNSTTSWDAGSTGGYQCSNCGQWITDWDHVCSSPSPSITPLVGYISGSVGLGFTDAVNLGRIADALERIVELLEEDD